GAVHRGEAREVDDDEPVHVDAGQLLDRPDGAQRAVGDRPADLHALRERGVELLPVQRRRRGALRRRAARYVDRRVAGDGDEVHTGPVAGDVHDHRRVRAGADLTATREAAVVAV